MSDAAEEIATEVEATLEGSEELPNFDIYSDDSSEEAETAAPAPEVAKAVETQEAPKEDTSWSARVKKDRKLRKREIEFKKREQEIAQREQSVTSLEGAKDAILKDPNAFFKSQGIDPLDFYSDWTNRLATGQNKASADVRLSATEEELRNLKAELAKRDKANVEASAKSEQNRALNVYYGKIKTFMASTDDYPLTKEQCTVQDIAQGIGEYYQKTGIELGFDEAFKLVEKGLGEKENNIFNDPSIIAKFKKYHGIDASKKSGKRSRVTLSNNLETQPTKTPAEDMTDDEIYEFWKGKLFT